MSTITDCQKVASRQFSVAQTGRNTVFIGWKKALVMPNEK